MDPTAITWHCQPFSALENRLLYQLLQLRQAIFVVEQNCPYPDLDNLDPHCDHLFALNQDEPVAYARCLPPGLTGEQSSIGRVLVQAQLRRLQLGGELMRRAIAHNFAQWPGHSIRIGAQAYLEEFYRHLGFTSEQDHYMEDGILHIHMQLTTTGEPH
ncbi:GNAT family N-acetyltransferase [Halieaceae bacterium IMCC14734]|uniref:GNAT family N-acetyltransferase n=1 Tax=Candidatus Litorirhabdus singularis TaxID=2518993 RepID=A0ABT3TC03_9GAMM|nr:GNAT family N-acetyltransferase [Candidatus Litorirhabdus singularis]MCX2979823.1 GNAT family N-acetyltransferase [Candidatus Litorirhabdus singularis]